MNKTLLRACAALALVTIIATPALQATSNDGAEQRLVYHKKCQSCHGKDGVPNESGSGSASFNDPNWQNQTDLDTIVEVIKNGKGKMKGYEGKLSEEEMLAVAKYIKTL
jgi:cytochrome c6